MTVASSSTARSSGGGCPRRSGDVVAETGKAPHKSLAAGVAGSGQADELRQEMADGLVSEGWITSPHVEAAFRAVPRHLFTPPGTPLETSYNGHAAPVLKKAPDGSNLSSVSGAVAAGEDDRPYGPFRSRQAEAFSTIGLKRGVHRTRRGVPGEFGADSPVPVTRSRG